MKVTYLKHDALLSLPEEGGRQDGDNSQIMEDVGSGIFEEIKKQL